MVGCFTSLVEAFASAVNKFPFRKDDKPRPSTNSSSRDTTWPPPHWQPSPSSYPRGGSYARDQAAGKPPVTSDYDRSFNNSKNTSPHAGASTRTQAFQPPPLPPRRQTTVRTTTTAAHNARTQAFQPPPLPPRRQTTTTAAHNHRLSITPSPAVQSRQSTSTSAHAQASYQRSPSPDLYGSSLTPSPAIQSSQPASTSAHTQASYPPYPDLRLYGSSITSSPAVQSRQSASTSAHAQASYQRSPSPDLYGSSLTPSPAIQSGQPASTSAHTQTSYPPYPDLSFYGSSLTPSPAVQSRQPASTSPHAQDSYQRSPSPNPAHRLSSLTSPARQPTLTCACGSHQFPPDPPHRVGSSPAPSPAVQPRQPTSTSSYAQASYQRPPDPDPADIFKPYQPSLTRPRTLYSPPADLQATTDLDGSWLTHVVQSPVLADLSDSDSEIEHIEDDDIGKELRDRAQRQHRQMRDALAQAKSAHKRGDYEAERMHKRVAMARRSAMEQLNAKAAKIIFHQKNKVCI